jgi:hypothetical protein
MGGACGRCGWYRSVVETREGKMSVEILSVDGRIILNPIFKKLTCWVWTELIWLG